MERSLSHPHGWLFLSKLICCAFLLFVYNHQSITKYDKNMSTPESNVQKITGPDEWQVASEQSKPTVDKKTRYLLNNDVGLSIQAAFADGLAINGVVYELMSLTSHRTKRGHQACAIVRTPDGTQFDVNLPTDTTYTAESLAPRVLTSLRVASIFQVFRSAPSFEGYYFTLYQLTQVTDEEIVIQVQSQGKRLEVKLPSQDTYDKEIIVKAIVRTIVLAAMNQD